MASAALHLSSASGRANAFSHRSFASTKTVSTRGAGRRGSLYMGESMTSEAARKQGIRERRKQGAVQPARRPITFARMFASLFHKTRSILIIPTRVQRGGKDRRPP